MKAIHQGHLSPGQRLPGARVFSELLGLNRKTVAAAMDELHSQGWIVSRAQRGTFVSEELPEPVVRVLPPAGEMQQSGDNIRDTGGPPFLEPLYLGHGNSRLIDDGVPDVRLAPLKLLFGHYRSLLSKKSFHSLLKYYHVEGDTDFRHTLQKYLHHTRGISTTTDNIFVTRGSQMGIYLVMASLLKSGDYCVTSHPGYSIVDNIAQHLGGKKAHAPIDTEGLVIAEVEKLCRRKKIRLLYVTPHHHYPTTITLSPARRIELLQLAVKYRFYILEDDYDYDFHYANKPVLPLASLDKSGRVIYLGSFTKVLSPSVRIRYFVAPAEVMLAANKLRRVIDRQGDPLLERAMSEFIKAGDLQRHLKKAVKIYRQRRDHFCSLLETQLSKYAIFPKPEGGMAVWLTFHHRKKLESLPDRLKAKGYLLDSDLLFILQFGAIRVGFASMDEQEMEEFVGVLRDCCG